MPPHRKDYPLPHPGYSRSGDHETLALQDDEHHRPSAPIPPPWEGASDTEGMNPYYEK